MHKIGYLEHGAATVDVMQRIERALDLDDILHPDKVVQVESGCAR